MIKDMTVGKPLKHIIGFCVPLLIGNLCQQFYNMTDSVVVGQGIGKDALAAVGSTGSLNFLVIGFVLGICSGFAIPVSQYFGAGDYKSMRRAIVNSFYLSAAIAVVITVLTMLFTRGMLKLMQTPDNIYDMAYSYISIIFAGTAATMFYNSLSCILRAVGDSRTPLFFLIIASLLNVVGDIVLVVNVHLNVAGAAIATVAAQVLAGLGCLFWIIKKFPILLPERGEWKFDKNEALHLLSMGLPMGFQFSITAIGTVVLQVAVNSLGSDIVAAVTAANKIQTLVTQPMETLGITMATYCGQNLGAKKVDRIEQGVRQTFIVMLVYCILAGILMGTLGDKIAYLFIKPEETAILGNISQFLLICGCSYTFLGMIFLFRNSIQGLGYSWAAMTAGIFELVARSAVALLLVYRYGFIAVCFASPSAWVAADILLIPVFISKMKLIKKQYPPAADNSKNVSESEAS